MKTTPVRWWRDDAARYHRRPPYTSPEQDVPTFDVSTPSADQLAAWRRYLDLVELVTPRDSLRLREPPPDPWEDFARRLHQRSER